jgi:uncharacterized protein YcbX
MATLDGIRIYPVKGLDGMTISESTIRPGGTLAFDREYALLEGETRVNAKQSDRFHRLATAFDPERGTLTVDPPDGEAETFDLEAERDRAGAWLAEYLGVDGVSLERNSEVGFVDRPSMGPSVISTATLETVASWFDGMTVESARRRLRANLEVGGVPAFWEDRFVGEAAPAFEVDGVRFEGVTPCGRCVVPQRDPDTGDPLPEFQGRFVRKRRETFPEWADRDAFDHFYTLMLISRVAEADRGETLSVGDSVTVLEQ